MARSWQGEHLLCKRVRALQRLHPLLNVFNVLKRWSRQRLRPAQAFHVSDRGRIARGMVPAFTGTITTSRPDVKASSSHQGPFRQHSNMSQEPSFGPSIEITISAPRSPTRKCIKRDRPPFGLSFTNSRISRWSASAWRALPALRANSRKKIPLVFSELCRPII